MSSVWSGVVSELVSWTSLGWDAISVSKGACIASMGWCWLASLVTGNCSQVDRLWSILPPVYSWIISFYQESATSPRGRDDLRTLVMTALITLWGVRLTYNYWRKGGYSVGEEDYRWPVLRKALPNKLLFQAFNLFFIAIYQNILVYWFTSPLVVAFQEAGKVPFGPADVGLALAFLVLLGLETVADQQQWNFQSKKWKMIKAKQTLTGEYARGFYVGGLFKYSRHPNAFCEIMLWWVIYAFSAVATGGWYNKSFWGAFLLTLLFQGSTTLTERISKSKYPAYGFYQITTSRLIPLPAGDVEKIFGKEQ